MRVGYDATPAACQHAGVGRYARELLREMVAIAPDEEFVLLCSANAERAAALLRYLPPGAIRRLSRTPLGDRAMTATWQRLRMPIPVERFTGHLDVFHGTDFVVPPSHCPRVVTIHDLSYVLAPQYGDPRLVSYLQEAAVRAIRGADRVITVSAAVAAEAGAVYPWARSKIVAIPNGVRAPESVRPAVEAGPPTLLCVGTIEPRKNHLTLLAALNLVREASPDARLVIAGRVGWQATDIEARLQAAVATGAVELVLAPTDDELETLLASATMAIYPSFYEGFGLPVLEAMARGVPVIASDIPAHREVAGNAALLVAPTDVERLAAAITALVDDSATLNRMSAAGVMRAKQFSWTETARRTLRVYRTVVEERTAGLM
ncbi:MAG TPA: glycosyltransferase family 1 protein [Thermomicrobiales bacterium]|nr:glycosyltransferase family 1 protein [Thermomicrobiales bacterium]